jgi:hypothetical protein
VPTPSKKSLHRVEAALVADRRVDHLRQRAGAGRAHQRPRRNQVGEVERGDAMLLGRLHDRRGADGEVGLEFAHGGQVLLERGAVLHMHAARGEPVAVGSDQAVRGQAVPT